MMTITCFIGVVVAVSLTSADEGDGGGQRWQISTKCRGSQIECLHSVLRTWRAKGARQISCDNCPDARPSPSWAGARSPRFFPRAYTMNASLTGQGAGIEALLGLEGEVRK